jgi:hypothetical protein
MLLENPSAENVYTKINSQLSENLPKGVTMNKRICISLISKLMKQGCVSSQLTDIFFSELVKNPKQYFTIEKHTSKFSSSNEYSVLEKSFIKY